MSVAVFGRSDQWAVGWLAAHIAGYLRSGDRRALKAGYQVFLDSPVATPDLKRELPTIPKEKP